MFCFKNDGKVKLKDVSEKMDCCNSVDSINDDFTEADAEADCNLCEDISIQENCSEEAFLTVSKIKLSARFLTLFSSFDSHSLSNIQRNFYLNKSKIDISPQLNSNKTVLLLI